jgi:hypothetical protein
MECFGRSINNLVEEFRVKEIKTTEDVLLCLEFKFCIDDLENTIRVCDCSCCFETE